MEPAGLRTIKTFDASCDEEALGSFDKQLGFSSKTVLGSGNDGVSSRRDKRRLGQKVSGSEPLQSGHSVGLTTGGEYAPQNLILADLLRTAAPLGIEAWGSNPYLWSPSSGSAGRSMSTSM